QREKRRAHIIHWLNVLLIAPSGEKHAKLASVVHETSASTHAHGLAGNASHVNGSVILVANTDRATLSCDSSVIDINVELDGGKVRASINTNSDVEVARSTTKGTSADRGVGITGRVP